MTEEHNPYQTPTIDTQERAEEDPIPITVYLYPALTSVAVFSIVFGTIRFLTRGMLSPLTSRSVLAILWGAALAGLVLGLSVGYRTWRRCLNAHKSRVALMAKRDELMANYGTEKSASGGPPNT